MIKFLSKRIVIAIIVFAVLLLSYSVCFLTFFPGVGMNDGLNILNFGMRESRQHPVSYVFFIVMFGKLGSLVSSSLDIGISLYVFFQILFVCILTAFMILWFFSKKTNPVLKILFFAYFSINPIIAMYSVSVLKDTLFSLALAICSICLYEIMKDDSADFKEISSYWILFTVMNIFIVLWRNNGKYIACLLMLLILILKPVLRKKALLAFMGIVVAMTVNLTATKLSGQEQMFQEVVGIPLQQICSVVANDGNLTDEDKAAIEKLISIETIKENYRPSTVDTIKWNREFDSAYLNEHKAEFLQLWIKIMPRNFGQYVKAYFDATYYFWNPLAPKRNAQVFFTIENLANNSWLPDYIYMNGIKDHPIIKGQIGEILRNYYILAINYPSEAQLFWIMVAITILCSIRSKKWNVVWSFSPLLILWLTIMVSTPVASSLRYVFAFVYALPVFVGILFIKDGENSNESVCRELFPLISVAIILAVIGSSLIVLKARSIEQGIWKDEIDQWNEVDLTALTELNGLQISDGQLIIKEEDKNGIEQGPFLALHPGKIAIKYELSSSFDETLDGKEELYTLQLSERKGKKTWDEKTIFADDVASEEIVSYEFKHKVKKGVKNVEFKLIPGADAETRIHSISWKYTGYPARKSRMKALLYIAAWGFVSLLLMYFIRHMITRKMQASKTL